MASTILADNGVSSGSAGLKSSADSTGVLAFQTTTAGGTATTAVTIDTSQNMGLGVTPSAWSVPAGKTMEIGTVGNSIWGVGASNMVVGANIYYASSSYKYANTGSAASAYQQAGGVHYWYNAASGTAGNNITFTQAMTLDASGNLLVGTTSGTAKVAVKGNAAGALSLVFNSSSAVMVEVNGSNTINGVDGTPNANGLMRIWKDSGNNRSISAAGTLNASGADYAEYMTKSGDFTVAKGDVVGIDEQGKLTNVFANAVSFVVKSTDPSYVGNDKWGGDIEGGELEAARQAVDRIAFAGQVPVNVTGATPGQYIVPVEDNGAIKGEAVSNPTFEQYQQAVGKVIAIEQDGRARIIVKVA